MSERSIGRVKDFLLNAEHNSVPSTIHVSSISQRVIHFSKTDPFDEENFDLGDNYNDEGKKLTTLPL